MDRIDDTIEKIVSIEWDMFQAVNEGGPRASCQEDRITFDGMRRGQFEAWSQEIQESYLDDLLNALLDERNLVNEKYIHMMKFSSPKQYARLAETIPIPSEKASKLASEISEKLLEQTVLLFEKFPFVSGSGRPLRSISDLSGVTSIETYQIGELLTFSVETLQLLESHLLKLEVNGQSLAYNILENSAKHYGYKTLEEAEAATKARIEKEGIQVSIGCSRNGSCS